MGYIESDARDADSEQHPFPSAGIGCFEERLKKAMATNSLRGFSKICGLSEATLRSYLSGATYPTLDRLIHLLIPSPLFQTQAIEDQPEKH